MTNAKSRLVRIIALALAVLMIVPMALVGCKKTTDTGVDQAAIDAAIKEALDAAQKAQDAADKAAQDAKDAQDKLAASEKEAADLQAQIDAMKNTTTTAAPATTTKAPVSEDAKVVDAYIASVLNDEESEFLAVTGYYQALAGATANGIYHKVDAKQIVSIIDTAKIAIQRAPSVDYVNQLVAALAADLDAVPTYAERVMEAYEAIDFASDVDVIDVVYAANLADAAYTQINTFTSETFSSFELEVAEELKAVVKAELASLREFGDDKLDLATLINQEYYRYTGFSKVSNADATKYAEILYNDAYKASKVDNIDAAIAAIFGTTAPNELKVENIVWGTGINGTYAGNKDAAKDIYEDYSDFYSSYKRDFAELQEAFEIAFVGESYILYEEGNYLKDKLAEAADRIVELEAAAKEYLKASFQGKLEAVANAFATAQASYLYTNKKDVDKVDALLTPWLAKYNFVKGDKNLDAIIGNTYYNNFVDAKAYVEFVNTWAAKAENIDLDALEDMIDDYKELDWKNKNEFSYSEYAAVAQALEAWYYGSWNANLNSGAGGYNADGINAASIKLPSGTTLTIDATNKAKIVAEVIEIADTDIVAALNYFRNTLVNAHVKEANEINKLMNQIETEGLALGSKDAKYAESVYTKVENFFKNMITLEFEVEDGKTTYDLKDTNADLINWARYEEVMAAYADASAGQAIKAEEIIKAYIAAFGTYDAEDGVVTINYDVDGTGAKNYTFEIEPSIIKFTSYAKVAELKKIYEEVQISLTQGINRDLVIVDADNEEVVFNFNDAVIAWRAISEQFYQNIFEKATTMALKVRNSALTDGYQDSANIWRANYAAGSTDAQITAIENALGKYAPKFLFVDGSAVKASSKKDGSEINIYYTKTPQTKDGVTYSYINAILAVDYEKYTTYDALSNVNGFDYAGYYKEINENLVKYYDKWMDIYLASAASHTDTLTVTENFVNYVVDLGLWTIEDKFTVYGTEYTVAIDTIGASADIKVVDDEGIEVDLVKYKDATTGQFKYYKVDFVKKYTETGIGGNPLNKIAVKLTAEEYTADPTTGKYTVASGVVVDLAKIVDDADILELEYVYNFADYVDAIKANIGLAPAGQKKINSSSAWYVVVTTAFVPKVVAAYAEYEFYTTVEDAFDAIVAAKNAAKTAADAAGDALIDELYKEYEKIYADGKYTFGGSITIEGAKLAAATFEAEVKAIAAKNPAPVAP